MVNAWLRLHGERVGYGERMIEVTWREGKIWEMHG